MKKRPASWLLLIPLALACPLSTPGSCDIVVLKNGNEVQGEVIRADDDHVVVKFSGGTLRLRRKDVEEIRLQDRDTYLIEEGEKQLRRGDHTTAIESFTEALRVSPESVRARRGLFAARLGLGASLREIGRYEEAREVLEKLRADAPDRDEVRAELRRVSESLRVAEQQEKEAVAQLEGGDVEEALVHLQDLYDRFPDRREQLGRHLADALVKTGDSYFRQQDWVNAAERYLAAITVRRELLPELRTRFVAAKLNGLRPLVENGEFAALETAAREGLEVAPASGPLRYYYGLAMEGQGEVRAAAEEYLAISGERRPSSLERSVGDLRAQAEKKLLAEHQVQPTAHPEANRVLAGDFRTAESRRFRVLHKNVRIAGELLTVAERVYDELHRRLGCSTHLRTKIRVTMHPSREDYLEASNDVASWSGGSHRVLRPMGVGGVLTQHEITCYQDQPGLLTETIPHEVAHSLLTHRLNNKPIPLWANEGFAILSEPTYVHRYYRRLAAQELTRRNLPVLADLTGRVTYPEGDVVPFYAQSFLLVEFLVLEKELGTFVNLLLSLSTGMSLEGALQRYYGLQSIGALERRWRSWVQDGFRR